MPNEVTGQQLKPILEELHKAFVSEEYLSSLQKQAKDAVLLAGIAATIKKSLVAADKKPDSVFNILDLAIIFVSILHVFDDNTEGVEVAVLYQKLLAIFVNGVDGVSIFPTLLDAVEFALENASDLSTELLFLQSCILKHRLAADASEVVILCESKRTIFVTRQITATDLNKILSMLQNHEVLEKSDSSAILIVDAIDAAMQNCIVKPEAAFEYLEILTELQSGPLAKKEDITALVAKINHNISTCLSTCVRFCSPSDIEQHIAAHPQLFPYFSESDRAVVVKKSEEPLTLHEFLFQNLIHQKRHSLELADKTQTTYINAAIKLWENDFEEQLSSSIFTLCDSVLENPSHKMRIYMQTNHTGFLLDYLCSSSARSDKYLMSCSKEETAIFMINSLKHVSIWIGAISKQSHMDVKPPHKSFAIIIHKLMSMFIKNIYRIRLVSRRQLHAMIHTFLEFRSLLLTIATSMSEHISFVDKAIVHCALITYKQNMDISDLDDLLNLVLRQRRADEIALALLSGTNIKFDISHIEKAFSSGNYRTLARLIILIYPAQKDEKFREYITKAKANKSLWAFYSGSDQDMIQFPDLEVKQMLGYEIQAPITDPKKIAILIKDLMHRKTLKDRIPLLIANFLAQAKAHDKLFIFYEGCKTSYNFTVDFIEDLLHDEITSRMPNTERVNILITDLRAVDGWNNLTLRVKGKVLWNTPYFLSIELRSPMSPRLTLSNVLDGSVTFLEAAPNPLQKIMDAKKILGLKMLEFIRLLLVTPSWENILEFIISKYPSVAEHTDLSTHNLWHDLAQTPEACSDVIVHCLWHVADRSRLFLSWNIANYHGVATPLELAFRHNNIKYVMIAVKILALMDEPDPELRRRLFDATFKYGSTMQDIKLLKPLLEFVRAQPRNAFINSYQLTLEHLIARRTTRPLRRIKSMFDITPSAREHLDADFENARHEIHRERVYSVPRGFKL